MAFALLRFHRFISSVPWDLDTPRRGVVLIFLREEAVALLFEFKSIFVSLQLKTDVISIFLVFMLNLLKKHF
jgi:hypothetical protein